MNRPDGTKIAKVIQVIETKAMRGLGSEKDPVREVSQYWDFDGKFLAEMDAEHCIPIIEHDANAIKESISSEQIIASSSANIDTVISLDGKEIAKAVRKSNYDNGEGGGIDEYTGSN